MAETFRNARLAPLPSIGTAGFGTVYTCPAGKTAVILSAQVANVEAAQVGVSLRWTDASVGGAVTYLTDEVQVPAAAALNPLAGKLVLEAGDTLEAGQEGSPLAALNLSVSVLELDNA
ncbi:hypothetical protein [Cereibacter azotoformans]|uniref:Uncharacterized protein n=1 Tax=Cereibacter azotoformans TaxID=43057 RepID=A0A2T5K785_9RHOB|nr:hypothetical protein [Cereibacter azotoformans]MBO4169545.1 hypothetical protein [Cereibacter azotoformans]PTR18222.1 hypothetical protein C8J28_109182 [Cereibacter azotoformans]